MLDRVCQFSEKPCCHAVRTAKELVGDAIMMSSLVCNPSEVESYQQWHVCWSSDAELLSVGRHFRQIAWLAGAAKAWRKNLVEPACRWVGMSCPKEASPVNFDFRSRAPSAIHSVAFVESLFGFIEFLVEPIEIWLDHFMQFFGYYRITAVEQIRDIVSALTLDDSLADSFT